MKNRIKGTLFGVAVGDALGAPAEFLTADEIKNMYGTLRDMVGGGWLDVRPGEVTDDTQMTLAVAHGITEKPSNPIPAIGRRFIEWYNSVPKDIGATCAISIGNAIKNKAITKEEWFDAAYLTHHSMGGRSGGNGSLMRTAYVGMYYPDELDVIIKAREISRMTHIDWNAGDACVVYCLMINRMIQEANLTARKAIIPQSIFNIHELREVYPVSMIASKGFTPNPSGYVVDSFKAALHCVLTTDSLEDAVIKAVNLGGDADTIGAITGGLAGALYGYDAIPARWLEPLERKEEMETLCEMAIKQWERKENRG